MVPDRPDTTVQSTRCPAAGQNYPLRLRATLFLAVPGGNRLPRLLDGSIVGPFLTARGRNTPLNQDWTTTRTPPAQRLPICTPPTHQQQPTHPPRTPVATDLHTPDHSSYRSAHPRPQRPPKISATTEHSVACAIFGSRCVVGCAFRQRLRIPVAAGRDTAHFGSRCVPGCAFR